MPKDVGALIGPSNHTNINRKAVPLIQGSGLLLFIQTQQQNNMKSQHHINLCTRATRLAVALLLSIVLLTSVSCSGLDFGSRAKDNAAAIDTLENRFDEMEAGLGGVVFWQALAAVFFVLSTFALVGGAALGSRAQRDRNRFLGKADSGTATPDNSTV